MDVDVVRIELEVVGVVAIDVVVVVLVDMDVVVDDEVVLEDIYVNVARVVAITEDVDNVEKVVLIHVVFFSDHFL